MPDKFGGFLKANASLFAVAGCKDDLPRWHPFRPQKVQQCQRSRQAGFPIAPRDKQKDLFHNPRTVWIARGIGQLNLDSDHDDAIDATASAFEMLASRHRAFSPAGNYNLTSPLIREYDSALKTLKAEMTPEELIELDKLEREAHGK